MTVQHLLAAVGLVLCLALLLHHGLSARHQARLHLWWRAKAARWRLGWQVLRHGLRRRREARHKRAQAEREAADLIERARRGGDSGNVVRPGRFGDRRKDLH